MVTTPIPFEVMARTYAYADLRVFPLWWPVGDRCACSAGSDCKSPGKHPVIPPAHPKDDLRRLTCKGECGKLGHGVHDATLDLDLIATWANRWPHANIGMAAGANGLAILDVDTGKGGEESFTRLNAFVMKKGIDLRATMTANTGSGGRHHVFAEPEGGIKSGSKVFGPDMPGLDTRGRGGYIVAAPSVHVTGGTYEWVDFCADAAPWPAILTKLMEPVRSPAPAQRAPLDTRRAEISDAYARAAFTGIINDLASVRAGDGQRNDRLNRSGYNLGGLVGAGLLDEGMVRDELLSAAIRNGYVSKRGEAAVRKIIDSALANGKLKPRTRVGA